MAAQDARLRCPGIADITVYNRCFGHFGIGEPITWSATSQTHGEPYG